MSATGKDFRSGERGREEAYHAAKPLLSCRVPKLKTNFEAVDVYLLGDEEGTGGRRHVLGIELVLCVPMKQASLPDACVGVSE